MCVNEAETQMTLKCLRYLMKINLNCLEMLIDTHNVIYIIKIALFDVS